MASILLIEDDTDIRLAAQEVLQSEGYAVVCACNGQEGLDQLNAGLTPDLILLDIMMPVMNGWQFREEQRRLTTPQALIPVIVLSADNRIEQKSKDMDVSEYIKKPIDLDALLKTIQRLLPSAT